MAAARQRRSPKGRAGTSARRTRPRKSRAVIDALGLSIVSGKLSPGELLPTEADLAHAHGLSRPSLREALTTLSQKGLVEGRTRRGTMVRDRAEWDLLDADVLRWLSVAPPDPAFYIDLLDVRMIFEPAAARIAAARARPEQIVGIETAFANMAAALPHDVEACCRHDLEFHERITAATGNRLLIRFAAAIRTALLAAFRLSSNARASYESSLAEHRDVAIAIRNRSPDEAEAAMRKLLAGTARDLAPAYHKIKLPRGAPPRRR